MAGQTVTKKPAAPTRPTPTKKPAPTQRKPPTPPSRPSTGGSGTRGTSGNAVRNGNAAGGSREAGNGNSANNARLNPTDRVEIQNRSEDTAAKTEKSVANVSELTRGLESNFATPEPTQQNAEPANDPRAAFFKDPERGQKIDQARSDLNAAKEGNHQELEQLREQQQGKRDETLAPAQEKADQKKAELETAEQNLQRTQELNQRAEDTQKSAHAEAQQERREARDELKQVQKPGQDSAAQLVDKMDGYEDSARGTIERNETAQKDFKEKADGLRNDIQDRYGDRLKSQPELQKDLDRFMQIDDAMKADGLSNYEKGKLRTEQTELRKKLHEVKDASGEHSLARDAGSLNSTLGKAKDRAEHTEKTVADLKQKRADTAEKAKQLYGREPGMKDKVDNYRKANDRVDATSPEGMAKTNEKRLDQAQDQLREATDSKAQADSELAAKTESYDKSQGVADKQELADKQKELVSELEDQVQDLTTIKSGDLSDAVKTSTLGFGQETDIKLDGNKLTYKKDGMNVEATGTENGGVELHGKSTEEGNMSSVDVTRSPKQDGGWQTDHLKSVKDDKWSTANREFTRHEDGSTKEVNSYKRKGSDAYGNSETITGADGSSVSHSKRKDAHGTTESTSKASAPREEFGGKQDRETNSHYVSNDGSYVNDSNTVTKADGTKISNSEDYHTSSWDNKKNVEGASWLWKDSPQNLRNAIGDDATYGTLTRTSSISVPGQETQTSKTESERWTSSDGKRTLEAQRGQEGLPDTWTFSNKKGDETHSQTFIRGTEDTSISHQFKDSDGFQVNETSEDFRETAGQIKEHTGKDTAESGHTTTRTKEEASMKDLEKLAKENPELAEFMKSSDFQKFRDAVGDEKFALAVRESQQTLTNGKEQEDYQLSAMGPDGHNLVIMGNGENGGMRFSEPGEDGYKGVTLLDGGGNRMEAGNDGHMSVFDSKGIKKFTKDLKKFTDAPGKIPHGIRGLAKEIPHDLSKLKTFQKLGLFQGAKSTDEMGDFMSAMKKYDSTHSATFGRAVDMLGAGLSAYDTYNKASEGDWGGASKSVASGFRDIGGLSKATGQGFRAANYVDEAGEAVKAWHPDAILKNTSKVGQFGKALGVAGAVYQAGEGVYDISQGRYARGGLGVAAAGGTALAIWGGASWAGPVGWGVAAAATAGIYTIDYVDSNAIAPPEIPLY
jgi:hypothetical protein